MAGVTIQMQADKQYPLDKIHRKLHVIKGAEQVSKTVQTIQDVTLWVLVYQKYYFRISSYASVSIVLTEYGQTQTACVVASGSGAGIANRSYGADRNFAKDCVSALEFCGFVVTESDLNKYGNFSLKHIFE